MVSLTHVLRLAVKETYQHIVFLVLLSLLSVTILSPSFFLLPIPFALVYIACLSGPLLMAMTWSIQQKVVGEKVNVKTFFKGLKKYFFRGVGYSLIVSFFLFIVISSWWYWRETGTYFSFILACFQSYFVSMIFISQMYTIPLCVKYEHSLRKSMLLSIKLLIKNPLYTLGAFVQLLSLGLLLGLTVVGFLFLYPGLYTILTNLITANIISSHDPAKDSELGNLGGVN